MFGYLRSFILCLTLVWAAVFSFRGGVQDSSDYARQTQRVAFLIDADQDADQEKDKNALSATRADRAMGIPGELGRMLKNNGKTTSHRHVRHLVRDSRVLSHNHHGGNAMYARMPQLMLSPQLAFYAVSLTSLPKQYYTTDYYVFGLRKILI